MNESRKKKKANKSTPRPLFQAGKKDLEVKEKPSVLESEAKKSSTEYLKGGM